MNKFKVGDEVRLKDSITSVYLDNDTNYTVEEVFYKKLRVHGVDFKYNEDIFDLLEILKESNMKKFKVGDKVVRVSETYGKAIKGGVYEVSGVSDNEWAGSCGINLKGHEGVSGKFNYESSCFELYDDDVLSPLEAAEALMNEDKLQVFDSDADKWYGFHNELRNITLEDLKHIKLRHKPKTVIINGVEVPAPLKTLSGRKSAFYIDLFRKVLVETLMPYDIKDEIMWETKEDAQQVLNAMLIPFNELNKGQE